VTVSGVTTRVAPLSTARYVDQPHLVPFKGTRRAAARGVDLNLDRFDLSDVADAAPREEMGSWAVKGAHSEPNAVVGNAFWKELIRGSASVFSEQDLRLLSQLFNPHLSDRRGDGDAFVPPDASREYVERLSTLLGEERATQQQRKEEFLSQRFRMEEPGPLFPASWASCFDIALGQEREEPHPSVLLHPRPDYMAEAPRFRHALRSATPVFDRRSEDGTRFRVYEMGDLQVRTLAEHDGKEVVAAFFSVRPSAPAQLLAAEGADEEERVTLVTQYVEAASSAAVCAGMRTPGEAGGSAPARPHFYAVLETEAGRRIVAERHGHQAASWCEQPAGLEARNSLARVMRALDARGAGLTLRGAKRHVQDGEAAPQGPGSESRRFAEAVYESVLAAWERSWAKAHPRQLQALQALGAGIAREWFEGRVLALRTAWATLSREQREAAETLGFSEDSWGNLASWGLEHGPVSEPWRRSAAPPQGPALVPLRGG